MPGSGDGSTASGAGRPRRSTLRAQPPLPVNPGPGVVGACAGDRPGRGAAAGTGPAAASSLGSAPGAQPKRLPPVDSMVVVALDTLSAVRASGVCDVTVAVTVA